MIQILDILNTSKIVNHAHNQHQPLFNVILALTALYFKMELSVIVYQNVLMFIHLYHKQLRLDIMEQELLIKEAFLQLHHANVKFLR